MPTIARPATLVPIPDIVWGHYAGNIQQIMVDFDRHDRHGEWSRIDVNKYLRFFDGHMHMWLVAEAEARVAKFNAERIAEYIQTKPYGQYRPVVDNGT